MTSPLVSVVVPAYNAMDFIGETLESILSQTYQNFEVLVVDDGSQDRTLEVVESYCRKDDRVTVLKQPNLGVAAARNLAIEHSRGSLIAPIDADDIWYPDKLEQQVQRFQEASPQVGLVYSWFLLIDEASTTLWSLPGYRFEGRAHLSLVHLNFVGNSSVPLIRRECFEKVGGYNTGLKQHDAQGCEDWDLYLRIAEHYDFAVVPEFLVGYRQVNGSMACNSWAMARSYDLVMADVRHRAQVPASIYRWSNSNFYLYLMGRCYGGGDYRGTLRCLYKAVRIDPAVLLWLRVYSVVARCLRMLLFAPGAASEVPSQAVVAPKPGRKRLTPKWYHQVRQARLAWIAGEDSARDSERAVVSRFGLRRRVTYLANLLSELVSREIKVQYQRSVLGVLWSLVNPLMQLVVFVFLFNQVLSVKSGGYSYPSFTFSGMLVWTWFQASLSQGASAITNNRELVRQPGFPAPILPVISVTTNLVYFLLSMPILALLLVAGGNSPGFAVLALPVVLGVQFMLTLGFAYLLSSINVVFRDTQHIVGVLLQLLFYLTPVFYAPDAIPARYRFFLALNPMAHLIEAYRAIFLHAAAPDSTILWALLGVALVLLGIGYQVFVRVSDRFIEEL